MPSEFYNLGYAAGRLEAEKNASRIKESRDAETLSLLAGRCLKTFQDDGRPEDRWYMKNPRFVLGFWESFMSKAEELK